MRYFFYFFYLLLLGTVLSLSSCKKPISFSGGNLSFSADTVIFDTVFTTVGSTTKRLKIYNNDKKTLKIEQIELLGGANSPFRINVDGLSGTNFAELEMEGEDSLFIFVEVTLDPNNQLNPMVIEDQIRFRTNGTDQYVELVAWGQDAYFHYSYISGDILDTNEGTWPNDKPHVIYGAAFVDSAKTLNIIGGTDIYLHKDAWLFNYKGTLNITGSLGNEVTLQGDRLEPFYDDVAGQYRGIYLYEALPSTIDYAIIRNGSTGIHIDSDNPANGGANTLSLYNTIIQNNSSYGVLIYAGGKLEAENCVIAENGVHSFVVIEGGEFDLNHCTIAGYAGGQDQASAVGISNYYNNPFTLQQVVRPLVGRITNSVMYGYLEEELAIDTVTHPTIDLTFDYNLIRSESILTGPGFDGFTNLWNSDPLFVGAAEGDYHFYSPSPMNGGGAPGPAYPIVNPTTFGSDVEGVSRISGPDIGAYEKP